VTGLLGFSTSYKPKNSLQVAIAISQLK
jgi:hypothetical protein